MNNSPRPITTAEYNDRVAKDMLEAVLQERVRQLFLLHHWRYYHTYRSQHSPAGFLDVCAVRKDRLIFAELKREAARYKLSAEQQAWYDDLEKFGRANRAPIEVYVWRPSDLISGRIAEILK